MNAAASSRPQLFDSDLPESITPTSDDWYTPRKYIEVAREVMQGIDLDPASSVLAQNIVKAGHYFTLDTNGLNHPWHGRVWLNPPYSRPSKFVDKLISECHAGRIEQAIILVNNDSETGWFHDLLNTAVAVCFPQGRIPFLSPIRAKKSQPRQGQTFFYFGPSAALFNERFQAIGKVIHLAEPAPINS